MGKDQYFVRLAIYDEVINSIEGLERKGKSMPYTSDNGHMFSQLNKNAEIGIRLSDADRAQFSEQYVELPFLSYGARMREYVLIPDEIIGRPAELSTWLQKGWDYVLSLPPK